MSKLPAKKRPLPEVPERIGRSGERINGRGRVHIRLVHAGLSGLGGLRGLKGLAHHHACICGAVARKHRLDFIDEPRNRIDDSFHQMGLVVQWNDMNARFPNDEEGDRIN